MPDVSEIICPGVHELEDVVTAIGIGDVQRNGADREIDLRHGIHGVVVDRDESVCRPGQCAGVAEGVERCGGFAPTPL